MNDRLINEWYLFGVSDLGGLMAADVSGVSRTVIDSMSSDMGLRVLLLVLSSVGIGFHVSMSNDPISAF